MRGSTFLAILAMALVTSCQSSSILEQRLDAASEEEICGAVRSAVYAQNRRMPSRAGKFTENVKVVASCHREAIVYTVRVLADESTFPPNWKRELTGVVRKAVCGEDFSGVLGWNFETIVLSQSDQVLARIRTRPEDCN